jgi:hypothetical protein
VYDMFKEPYLALICFRPLISSFKDGCTALMLAAMRGHQSAMAILLEKGANINAIDNDGCTALIYAARHGREPVIITLLANNADTEATNQMGRRAVDLATGSMKALLLGQNPQREAVNILAVKHAQAVLDVDINQEKVHHRPPSPPSTCGINPDPLGSHLIVYPEISSSVRLYHPHTNRHVSMNESGDVNSLSANRGWERFIVVEVGNSSEISLYNAFHNRFLSMDASYVIQGHRSESGYDSGTIAGILPSVSALERFQVINAGGGKVALYSRHHSRFMRVEHCYVNGNGGLKDLETLPTESEWPLERFVLQNCGVTEELSGVPVDGYLLSKATNKSFMNSVKKLIGLST